jgi:hypothetical protein
MTTVPAGSPGDYLALGPELQYCPQCAHRRVGLLRLCGYCRFDFEVRSPVEAANPGPPTPSVRLVPSDAPPPAGITAWGRGKRWLLLGPIAAM